MIDLHILVTGKEYQPWYDECLNSISGHPVTLHLCEGIIGDIPRARANAIAKGTNPYVAWVDPDDYVLPGAYQKLLDAIGDSSFCWMKEYEYKYNDNLEHIGTTVRVIPHHIHIIHRDVLDYNVIAGSYKSDEPAEVWIRSLSPQGVFVNDIGYVYRRYRASPASKLREQGVLRNKNVR